MLREMLAHSHSVVHLGPEMGQILQLGQMLHSVVSEVAAATESELGHILQLGQMLHSVVSEFAAATESELGHILQLGQMLHSVVSEFAAATESELGHILQLGQMLHSVVSEFAAATESELGHILQLGQMLHSVVSEFAAATEASLVIFSSLAKCCTPLSVSLRQPLRVELWVTIVSVRSTDVCIGVLPVAMSVFECTTGPSRSLLLKLVSFVPPPLPKVIKFLSI